MLTLRPLTVADVPVGMRLKEQAGWNQLEEDWRQILALGEGLVAELDGVPVGTTCAVTFGPVAWVAMVLVDASVRGRGVGRALMERALEGLDRKGVPTVRLDATPLGQPLYEKLGFVAQFPLDRHEGVLPPSPAAAGVAPLPPQHLDRVAELDQSVTHTARRPYLRQLAETYPETLRGVLRGGRLDGFILSRPGARARQIGPCLASPESGPLLLRDAWHRYAGERVYVDIPLPQAAATRLAQAAGLRVQRTLLRMCRGPVVSEDPERFWVSSGPALG